MQHFTNIQSAIKISHKKRPGKVKRFWYKKNNDSYIPTTTICLRLYKKRHINIPINHKKKINRLTKNLLFHDSLAPSEKRRGMRPPMVYLAQLRRKAFSTAICVRPSASPGVVSSGVCMEGYVGEGWEDVGGERRGLLNPVVKGGSEKEAGGSKGEGFERRIWIQHAERREERAGWRKGTERERERTQEKQKRKKGRKKQKQNRPQIQNRKQDDKVAQAHHYKNHD